MDGWQFGRVTELTLEKDAWVLKNNKGITND